MPLYEYECGKCGVRFEHLARTLSDRPAKCPKCGARGPEKQMSSFSARSSEGHAHDSGGCDTGACGGCQAAGSCPYE